MIFAGVFGTIIGFYFGIDGAAPADPPTLGTPLFAAGKVSVEVRGGRRPLLAEIILANGARQGMTIADNILSYTVATCPAGARIQVRDSDYRIADADVTCPLPAAAAAGPAAATNTITANTVAGNGI